MERIVTIGGERVLMRGIVLDDCWEVRERSANGHRELSFKNRVIWEDTGERAPDPVDVYLDGLDPAVRAEREAEYAKELEEKREKADEEKNAAMAKTKCRWMISSLASMFIRGKDHFTLRVPSWSTHRIVKQPVFF